MPDHHRTGTRSRPLDAAAFVFNRQFHFIRSSSPNIRNICESRFDKNKILLRIAEINPIPLNDSFFILSIPPDPLINHSAQADSPRPLRQESRPNPA
ncbi:hypothetical protein C5O75_033135 [Burkholderia cepacia]|uniref:hypothetical protein n=1 Tax=Burkholderia cepacia TaxID=292 RepID=UPI0011B05BE7|nr:hypothetical protein [Burkholderia cepacia]KAB1585195.1 hypothetical protein C5O75_033135 [Burkholderia cepacia]